MIAAGTFNIGQEYDAYLERVEKLLENPDDVGCAWQLGFDDDVMKTAPWVADLRCWIESQILSD